MPFIPTNAERVAGNLTKHFSYKTTDAQATATGAGYFNDKDFANTVDKGDIITVISDMGTATPLVARRVVTSLRGVNPVTTAAG